MDVRVVRMLVHQDVVPVGMRVRFGTIPGEVMGVLVVFVMAVPMRVLHHLMRMLVFMSLPDVKPHAQGHQCRCKPEDS